MEDWSAIVGTLSGVVLGGLISLSLSAQRAKHEKNMEVSKRRIEKLEMAHELLTKIAILYRSFYGSNTMRLLTKSDREREPMERFPFEELEMLFSYYATEHLEEAKKLIAICHEYGAFTLPLHAESIPGKEKITLKELQRKHSEIESQISNLKEKLAESVRLCLG